MALLAGTGILSGAMLCTRELVAASSTFQSVVGEVTEAAALNHVFSGIHTNPTRPYAIVGMPREDSMALRDGYSTGVLRVSFEFDMNALYLPDKDDTDAAASEKLQNGVIDFGNKIGAIRSEMILESHQAGRLLCQGMDLVSPGMMKNSHDEEYDKDANNVHYFWCTFDVRYGVQQL